MKLTHAGGPSRASLSTAPPAKRRIHVAHVAGVMRAALLLLVLLAGCASPEPSTGTTPASATVSTASPPTTATEPPGTAPGPASPPGAPAPSSSPTLGIVLDETHDFSAGGRKVSTFNVTGAETKVVIEIGSGGPPSDGSFTNAVTQFYFPDTTSPFLAELPGQETRDVTTEQQPHRGTWRIVHDGSGRTTIHVRVTLQ